MRDNQTIPGAGKRTLRNAHAQESTQNTELAVSVGLLGGTPSKRPDPHGYVGLPV
jgi:hypothetical protein